MFTVFGLSGPSIMTPGSSNEPDPISGHGGGGGEEGKSFLSFKELLLGIGGAQESQRTGLRLGGEKGANINSSSSVHPRSDGLTAEEQSGRDCSLSTLPISVASSEAGYDL